MNGAWLWLQKRWFIVPTIIIVASALVTYGQHESEQDSLMKRNTEIALEAKTERKENAEKIELILRNQEVVNEFFKLFKPELFDEAVKKSGGDSLDIE